MNWKSTAVLVVLAVAAGAWLWKGDSWVPALAPKTAPPDPQTLAAFEADFTPDGITRIEVSPIGGDSFVLDRTATGWTQPGNWPLRTVEVEELVATLANLRTRFQPVPLPNDGDLSPVGLADAQKPVAVKVNAGGKQYMLKFGEPALKPGEAPFTRAAFVRVNDSDKVLKLGPDVMPVLRRPAETYRRRQLFSDVERVKFAGGGEAPTNVTLPGAGVTEIRVTGEAPKVFGLAPWWASGTFTLKRIGPTPAPVAVDRTSEPAVPPDRLADAWAIDAPVRERPDPAKLQQVLAAVPDLWVEDFIPATQIIQPDPRDELKVSKKSVSVTTKAGTVTVRIGGIAKTAERDEQVTIPGPPGVPPRTETRKVPVVFRYAQIVGNPQLFTVPAEKLDAMFVKTGDLAEARVARFGPDDVQAVTVTRPGAPALALTRKPGDPRATSPDERGERWVIEQAPNPLPADAARVREFIDRVATFRGAADTDLYRTDPKARGLDPAACITVTLTVREKRVDGDGPAREYKILVGAPDAGKLPVQLAGWPRIALLTDRIAGGPPPTGWLGPVLFPDRLEPLFTRDAISYRSRKLFDTADARLTGVAVDGASAFALKQEKLPDGRDVWKLTAPVASDADPMNTAVLVGQLGDLQATEFVSAAAKPEHGLDKPKFTASLTFGNGRTYKLEVGAARPGKPEVFARLDGGAVFALPTATTDSLATGALKLLPLQVWTVPLDKVTGLELTRPGPGESFALTKDGTNWKLSGPFTAPVTFLDAQPLLAALSVLPATSYDSLTAADAKYGFDKPFAKVKLSYTEKSGDVEKAVTKAVVIGNPAPGGADRYAKLDDPAAPVFVLPVQYLFAVGTSPLSLLDRNLLNLDPAKITKVQIAPDKPESAVTLLKDEKGVWKAEGAAFTVDALVAGQVALTFAPLSVERLAAFGDAVKWADFGLDKPEYTVTVTLGGDKPATRKIQLGKTDVGGGRFVRVDDGKAVGVVRADAVQALTRAKLDFADRTLLTFKPEELLAIARLKGKEEFELAPGAGDGWDVTKPAKQKADKALVEELAETLGRLRAEKVAAFGKKEDVFKQYGLEPAEAVVTLMVGDKPKVLRLGKPVDAAKPAGDRFAAVEAPGADAAVAVLPAAFANKLLAPPVSFRDRALARFVDADKLELVRGPRKVTFAKVNGTWKVTSPLASDAEQAALDDLVGELARLRASDWVAEKPAPADLKTFGLDNPEATWIVSNGDKVELKLVVGKSTPDGRAYALAGASGMVALLGKAETTKVLAEYRVRKPWVLDAFQAESVEITRGDKLFMLQKRGAGWVDPGGPADVIDPRAVTELLGALTALRVERYAVDADGDAKLFGLEKPEVTIAVTTKDGPRRVLEIGGPVGGTDDKQRYARVVDKGRSDVFVLSAADTARFTRDRAVYVQKK